LPQSEEEEDSECYDGECIEPPKLCKDTDHKKKVKKDIALDSNALNIKFCHE